MVTFHFDPQARLIRLSATVSDGIVQTITFAIDTGASRTVIARDVAFDLGFNPDSAPTSSVTTASGVEPVTLLTISRLDTLGHSVTNLDAVCMDLPPTLQVEGLLGLNFLRHFKLFVNFPKGVLVLQEKNSHHLFHWLSQLWEIARAHRS